MAAKVRGLLEKDGRFHVRKIMPVELRLYGGAGTELRMPLGADRRTALRNLLRALALFEDRLDLARQAQANANGIKQAKVARKASLMTAEQLGHDHSPLVSRWMTSSGIIHAMSTSLLMTALWKESATPSPTAPAMRN